MINTNNIAIFFKKRSSVLLKKIYLNTCRHLSLIFDDIKDLNIMLLAQILHTYVLSFLKVVKMLLTKCNISKMLN